MHYLYMIDSDFLLTVFVLSCPVFMILIVLWIFSVHRFAVDIQEDQKRIVWHLDILKKDFKMVHDSLDSLMIDGDVYLKEKDNIEINTSESIIYEDGTGHIKGEINRV